MPPRHLLEIAVVAVWQVADTAKAVFAVDDVTGFVATQAEIAARQTASSYPYDDHGTGRPCLRASTAKISAILVRGHCRACHARGRARSRDPDHPAQLRAGDRARHAAPPAGRGRRRGRQKIVDGAVGMVESALARLAADGIIEFDEERKAAMVSNMLVVLCSDQATQPVINTGTVYQ